MKDAGLYRANLRRSQRVKLGASYKRIGQGKKSDRVLMCGSEVSRTACPDEGADHYESVRYASRCHVRFCASCAEKAASIAGNQLYEALRHIAEDGKPHRYIHVMLTIKNCEYDKLGEAIDIIMAGWLRMKDQVFWKKYVLGAVRNIEITRNAETKTFHPHLHLMLEMAPGYWREGYKNQRAWSAYWKECAKLDYGFYKNPDGSYKLDENGNKIPVMPYTYLRVVGKREKELKEIDKECREEDEWLAIRYVSKYVVKPDAIMDGVTDDEYDEILMALESGLGRRRLRATTGSIKKARKELNHKDPEEMEDSDDGEEPEVCPTCGKQLVTEIYHARGSGYCLKRRGGEVNQNQKEMPPWPIVPRAVMVATSAAPTGGPQGA